MKTQDEIVARIKERKKEDWLGFETDMLLVFLDFSHAKEFLKDDITESEWKQETRTPTKLILYYMPFAWDKANNCRGISANRSIAHFISWLWLDGKSGWLEKEKDHYEYYGKPQLVRICEEYGIDWRKLDNDRWVNSEGEEPLSASQALNL